MGCRGVTGQHYSEILEYLHLKMLSFCHAAVSQAVRQKKRKKKTLLEEAWKNEFPSYRFSAHMGCWLPGQTELTNVSYLPQRHCWWGRVNWDRSAHLTSFVPRF